MPATKTLVTDFGQHKADVANVIPPQKAGAHRRGGRRRRPHRLVPDRSGHLRVEAAAEHPCHRRRRDRRRDAEVGLRRQRAGQGLRRRGRAAARAASTPAEPQADQHLLQPGRARLRHLGRRRLSRRRTGSSPTSPGAGGVSPIDAPRATRARWRRVSPRPGSRRSPARCSAERCARGLRRRCCWRCAGGAWRRRLRPYAIVGDAIPASLTGAPGDRGARPGDRRQPAGRALPAVPFAARFPRSGSRATWRRTSRAPARAGRRASCGCGSSTPARLNPDTIMPPYYRIDGLDAGGAGLSRQADPDRRADRGRGGLS